MGDEPWGWGIVGRKFSQSPGFSKQRIAYAWVGASAIGTAIALPLLIALEAPSVFGEATLPNLIATAAFGAVFGGIAGPVPSLIVGSLLHNYMREKGWTKPLAYMAFGAVVSPAAILLLLAVAGVLRGSNGSLAFLAIFAFSGLIAGGVFWLIRRPDRDILVEETRDEPTT